MKINRILLPYILIAPLFILLVLLTFYPLLLTIFNSLQSLNLGRPDDIRFVGLTKYIGLMTDPAVLNAMRNSVQYFMLSVSMEILGGIVIALGLRNKFRGRAIILGIVILRALPPVVNSIVWKWIYDPSYGLLKVAFDTIPIELEEAAMVDGASPAKTLLTILPLAVPGIVAVATLTFLSAWSQFVIPLVFSPQNASPITVLITQFVGRTSIDYGLMSAAGIIAIIPPLLTVMFLSKYLVDGLMRGAIKN